MIKLRKYQQDCLEAIKSNLNQGLNRQLISIATGGGKTEIFSRLPDYLDKPTMLVLAHREELLTQAMKKIHRANPDLSVDLEQAEFRADRYSPVVVASVPTLGRESSRARMERFDPEHFSVIVVDECFVAGTKVDGINIEDIKVGDYVTAFNEKTGEIKKQKVTHVFKNKADKLVRIKTRLGNEIICTPNHPFFSGKKWVNAIDLTKGMVLYIMLQEDNKDVHLLNMSDGISGIGKSEIGVQKWQECSLQPTVPESTEFKDGCGNEPQVCLRENEEKKPHEECSSSRKGQDDFTCNGVEAYGARGERQAAPVDSATSSISIGLGNGACGTNEDEARQWVSDLLQSGYWEQGFNDRFGDRREFTLCIGSTGAGCEETSVLGADWVESVEILKSGDPEFVRYCSAEDSSVYVYNLEVEGFNTYFANNTFVHNCHHAIGKTYLNILRYFQPQLLVGFTATPCRTDRRDLADIYDAVTFDRNIVDLYREGSEDKEQGPYLARLVGRQVRTQVDLTNVHVNATDFNEQELALAVNVDTRNSTIISAIEQHAQDRRSILIFCVNVEHVDVLTQALRLRGHSVTSVVGATKDEDRKQRIQEFEEGKTRIMVSCNVFTEGVDIARIDCLVMARPTKSYILYSQMLGRGTRIFPGKEDCLVLDVIDILGKHQIRTIGEMFGARNIDLLGQDAIEAGQIIEQAEELGLNVDVQGDNIDDIRRRLHLVENLGRRIINIDTEAQLIDIFHAFAPAEEVQKDSDYPWVKLRPDFYVLNMPDGTVTRFFADQMGRWLINKVDRRSQVVLASLQLAKWNKDFPPFKWADSKMKLINPDTHYMKRMNAQWRFARATPNQIDSLKKMGIKIIPSGLTKGAASDIMDKLKTVREYGMARM